MNRRIKVTSYKSSKKKFSFRYKFLIMFIIAILIVAFIIYMLQTSVNDII